MLDALSMGLFYQLCLKKAGESIEKEKKRKNGDLGKTLIFNCR